MSKRPRSISQISINTSTIGISIDLTDDDVNFDKNISNEIDDSTICRDILQKIFTNSETADVILVAGIDNVSVPANRIVLSAASEYFSTLFTVNMLEKTQKKITMNEVDGETLQALINYCYSGQIKITAENVLKILSVASMFIFDKIKNECQKHLTEQLAVNPGSCLDVLQIAEKYSFDDLYAKSFEMIGKHFRNVVQKAAFSELPYPLFERILQSDKRIFAKEEEIFEAAMKWVNYDVDNRKEFTPEILKSIRLVHIDMEYLNEHIRPLCEEHGCSTLLTDSVMWNALPSAKRIKLLTREQTTERATPMKLFVAGKSSKPGSLLNVASYCFSSKKWIPVKELHVIPYALLEGQMATQNENLYYLDKRKHDVLQLNLCTFKTRTLPKKIRFNDSSAKSHKLKEGNGLIIMDQKLYVIGGGKCNKNLITLNKVSCYDLSKDEWSACAAMSTARGEMGLAILNGLLYVIGGSSSLNSETTSLKAVERYNPLDNTWSPVANMNKSRFNPGVGVLHGKIYVIGGRSKIRLRDTVEVFDPATSTWTFIATLAFSRDQLAVAVYENQIFAIGGNTASGTTLMVEVYNMAENKWMRIEPLPTNMSNVCATFM